MYIDGHLIGPNEGLQIRGRGVQNEVDVSEASCVIGPKRAIARGGGSSFDATADEVENDGIIPSLVVVGLLCGEVGGGGQEGRNADGQEAESSEEHTASRSSVGEPRGIRRSTAEAGTSSCALVGARIWIEVAGRPIVDTECGGMKRDRYRTVVVGTGPGGATLARELARAGDAPLVLERGRDWRASRLFGTYAGALLYADRHALLFTSEGLNVIRPLMLGGATSMYCGCSAPPADWWRERYGIDLDQHARAAADELRVGPLPPELRGEASTRIAEAGGELGMVWHPQDKFMRPARADRFDCNARCVLGCRCGAKWSAAEWVDDAVAAGATLWTQAKVDRILLDGDRVVGVAGRHGGEMFEIEADRVVVAAGGIGSAVLLRASGLEAAGRGMTMDTTAMVYGHAPFDGNGGDPPMTWSSPDDELGVLYSTLIDPWLNYPIALASKGPKYPLTWHRWGRTLGVMIKLKDEISGEVQGEGRIVKGLTPGDQERLGRAEDVARRILRVAGCKEGTIFTTPLRGTHPSGTVRIGEVVDRDLKTEIEGLYVCDASVFPEALCRPTVLTIIALARRLANHLASAGGVSGVPRSDRSADAVSDAIQS